MLLAADVDNLALLIPILAVVLGIGTGMLSLLLRYRRQRAMFALYHEERMAAIDKGVELPPLPEDFFSDDWRSSGPRSPHRTLLAGLVCLFAGVGLSAALYYNVHRNPSVALFGLIPIGLGVAYLVYYAAVGRREALEIEEARRVEARKQRER
ncbi:MAG TPA: hypothetical protein DCM86_02140 [Verrucomicrobiales bacterium]|nr:hypothetical protein [Verrucomicrobiales bacterium]